MRPVFVLVHSPSVGPLTWGPVADALTVRQHDRVIPTLLDVVRCGGVAWRRRRGIRCRIGTAARARRRSGRRWWWVEALLRE
jgi:hypothetical protein